MKLSFSRITTSGRFIPEIDGLRFIAIASVLLFHINGFTNVKDIHQYSHILNNSFLLRVFSHGNFGVPLFFVISGFILGLPFAEYYRSRNNPVKLKTYYLRRITRLEPPYFLVMTLLFLLTIYLKKTIPPQEGLMSYCSSLIYCHNFFYPGKMPKLNVVAWSLEIEIQFYILAPFLAKIFSIKNLKSRRILLTCAVFLLIFLNNFCVVQTPVISILYYLQYFLTGFLLVDLFIEKRASISHSVWLSLLSLFLFLSIYIWSKENFSSSTACFFWESFQLASSFLFFYLVLCDKYFSLLSKKIITNIGGMCYTIYLIHYPLISLFGNTLVKHVFVDNFILNRTIYFFLLIGFILLVSGIFFLLIEKPCMDKNWPKKLVRKLQSINS